MLEVLYYIGVGMIFLFIANAVMGRFYDAEWSVILKIYLRVAVALMALAILVWLLLWVLPGVLGISTPLQPVAVDQVQESNVEKFPPLFF